RRQGASAAHAKPAPAEKADDGEDREDSATHGEKITLRGEYWMLVLDAACWCWRVQLRHQAPSPSTQKSLLSVPLKYSPRSVSKRPIARRPHHRLHLDLPRSDRHG